MARRKRNPKQMHLDQCRWGGVRPGAGRPRTVKSRVAHRRREPVLARHPVHVTMRLASHVWNLRSKRCYVPLERVLRAAQRADCRIVEHSIQTRHIHLIVEVDDQAALGRGMRGLAIRIARALNALMGTQGSVFAGRYHAHVLRTPSEVRHAIAYVLGNGRRHHAQRGRHYGPQWLDPFSSAVEFAGWSRPVLRQRPVWMGGGCGARPHSWLLRVGWKKAGELIDPAKIPGPLADVPA